jgi:hypothetical protein
MFVWITGRFLRSLQISFLITTVLRIQIRMFLPRGSGFGYVIQRGTGTEADPDPSIIKLK